MNTTNLIGSANLCKGFETFLQKSEDTAIIIDFECFRSIITAAEKSTSVPVKLNYEKILSISNNGETFDYVLKKSILGNKVENIGKYPGFDPIIFTFSENSNY